MNERNARSYIRAGAWGLVAAAAGAAAAVLVLAFIVGQEGPPDQRSVAVAEPAVESDDGLQVVVPDASTETDDGTPLSPVREAPPDAVAPALPPTVDRVRAAPGEGDIAAARTIEDEITRIDELIAMMAREGDADESVDPELLREITESIAFVAEQLEAGSDVVSKQQVVSYLTATAHARTLLAAARAGSDDALALSGARQAAQHGVSVASYYIRHHFVDPDASADTQGGTPLTPVREAPPDAVVPALPPTVDRIRAAPGEQDIAAARTIEDEITHIEDLVAAIAVEVEADHPVDPALLREVTESIAFVAEKLETRADVLSEQKVTSYLTATAESRLLFAAARADEDSARALSVARQVAQNGVVVASYYIRDHF